MMLQKVYTNKAPEAIGPYSQGIVVNEIFFSSGQIPVNPDSGEIEGSTVKEQAEQVMKNLKAVLAEAGSDFDHVIKTTCFLTDMKNFGDFNEVYGSHFTAKPARSCVAVRELPKGSLCEVEVIAAIAE